ncbi:MAG: DUF1566 domain-containing protein, partial [Gammaproteobacteria bacterium]|nr:DUF1566 domain-containing protein [Gammaproteobacteria bacterium]
RCPIGFNSLGSICTNKKYVEGSTSELQRKKFTWQEALNIADQYEQNTSSGLKSDWRLPNIRELMSIIDTSCISPAFNSAVFPLIPSSTKSGLWSSSPQLVNPTSDRQKAWLIQTAYGDIIHDYITEKHFVLLVHSLP